jgi:hypothetical protein
MTFHASSPPQCLSHFARPRVRPYMQVASCWRPARNQDRRQHQIHIARCTPVPNRPRLRAMGAFWTPASWACGSFVIAGVQKPAQQETSVFAERCGLRFTLDCLTGAPEAVGCWRAGGDDGLPAHSRTRS